MSITVRIRTEKHPAPKDIFEAFVKNGESIIVTSPDYPCVKFGNPNTALRGIELNEEDNGIEVRVCSFGSADDYRLFAKAIDVLMKITGGKAYYDDSDEDEITDPFKRFDESWVYSERESSFNVHRIFSMRYGHVITLNGLFAPICIGPRLLSDFEITWEDDTDIEEDIDRLQDYLVSVQWHLANLEDTSTRMVMPNPNDQEERSKSISLITLKEGKVSHFDYISHADILCLMDMDNKDVSPVLVPFDKIVKIIPNEGFRLLDEYQFERTEELTPQAFHQMMERARIFQPDDLFHPDMMPGDGYDEKQNTVILMWNPAISSVKLEDHNASIPNMYTEDFNWSVWEHDKAKCGDRFFLVRCGEGNTGIVMSGVFESNPYMAGDWSGKGRQTFYMEMSPNIILDPDKAPMLTTAELENEIPDFQWSGGHSGRILPTKDAKKLEKMWEAYLKKNHDAINGITMNTVGQFESLD